MIGGMSEWLIDLSLTINQLIADGLVDQLVLINMVID